MDRLPHLDAIDEILSRYQCTNSAGGGAPSSEICPYVGDSRGSNARDVDTEEYEDSHASFDETGAHVGMSRSKRIQTPYGMAETNVGVQMSVGPQGVSVESRSCATVPGPNGRMMFMSATLPMRRYGMGSCRLNPFSALLGIGTGSGQIPIFSLMHPSYTGSGTGYPVSDRYAFQETSGNFQHGLTDQNFVYGASGGHPFADRFKESPEKYDGPIITEVPEVEPQSIPVNINPVKDSAKPYIVQEVEEQDDGMTETASVNTNSNPSNSKSGKKNKNANIMKHSTSVDNSIYQNKTDKFFTHDPTMDTTENSLPYDLGVEEQEVIHIDKERKVVSDNSGEKKEITVQSLDDACERASESMSTKTAVEFEEYKTQDFEEMKNVEELASPVKTCVNVEFLVNSRNLEHEIDSDKTDRLEVSDAATGRARVLGAIGGAVECLNQNEEFLKTPQAKKESNVLEHKNWIHHCSTSSVEVDVWDHPSEKVESVNIDNTEVSQEKVPACAEKPGNGRNDQNKVEKNDSIPVIEDRNKLPAAIHQFNSRLKQNIEQHTYERKHNENIEKEITTKEITTFEGDTYPSTPSVVRYKGEIEPSFEVRHNSVKVAMKTEKGKTPTVILDRQVVGKNDEDNKEARNSAAEDCGNLITNVDDENSKGETQHKQNEIQDRDSAKQSELKQKHASTVDRSTALLTKEVFRSASLKLGDTGNLQDSTSRENSKVEETEPFESLSSVAANSTVEYMVDHNSVKEVHLTKDRSLFKENVALEPGRKSLHVGMECGLGQLLPPGTPLNSPANKPKKKNKNLTMGRTTSSMSMSANNLMGTPPANETPSQTGVQSANSAASSEPFKQTSVSSTPKDLSEPNKSVDCSSVPVSGPSSASSLPVSDPVGPVSDQSSVPSTPSAAVQKSSVDPWSTTPTESVPEVTFEDLVRTIGLKLKGIHADGNCLFSAVVDQLRIRGEFFYTAYSLRQAAVDYLTENPLQEDGTHLAEFIGVEGWTWERYLSAMRREGAWGDHIIIWALANLLDRRILIYSGQRALHVTDIAPAKTPSKTDSESEIKENKEETGKGCSETVQEKAKDLDEIYLGHIAEAHYVSLRPIHWKDKLMEELSKRKESCLKPRSKKQEKSEGHEPHDSNGDVTVRKKAIAQGDPRFTINELNFFFNFVRRHNFLYYCQLTDHNSNVVRDNTVHYHVCNFFTGMDYAWRRCFIGRQSRSAFNSRYLKLTFSMDTRVRNPGEAVEPKDLLMDTTNCEPGFLKLLPVTHELWTQVSVQEKSGIHLKHFGQFESHEHEDSLTGILSSWPTCVKRWQKRTWNWPSEVAIQEVLASPCHVKPARFGDHDYKLDTSTIWEYCFSLADHILYIKYIPHSAKVFYFIAVDLLQFMFFHGSLLNKHHWKTLFFFMLERTAIDKLKQQPGACFFSMLDFLDSFLKKKFFPDFYMPEKNILCVNKLDEDCQHWHLQQLALLKRYPFQLMFHALDRHNLQEVSVFMKLTDELIKLVVDRPFERSKWPYVDWLVPIMAEGVWRWIELELYSHADSFISVWYRELRHQHADGIYELTDYVTIALKYCNDSGRWLFAFYLDSLYHTNWLQYIMHDYDCVPLGNVLGNDEDCLTRVTDKKLSDIFCPQYLLYSNHVSFLLKFTRLLDVALKSPETAIRVSYNFLKCSANDILLGIVSEKRNQEYSFNLGYLYQLFVYLYHLLYESQTVSQFFDLMDLFDRTCRCLGTEDGMKLVAKLWGYFGNSEEMERCLAVANAIAVEHCTQV